MADISQNLTVKICFYGTVIVTFLNVALTDVPDEKKDTNPLAQP